MVWLTLMREIAWVMRKTGRSTITGKTGIQEEWQEWSEQKEQRGGWQEWHKQQ